MDPPHIIALLWLLLALPASAQAHIAFQSAGSLPVDSAPTAFAVDPPRVIIASDSGLSVLKHNGKHFPILQRLGHVRFVKSFALGDFTGDRHPDIACVDGRQPYVYLFPGDRRGHFRKPEAIAVGPQPRLVRRYRSGPTGSTWLFVSHNEGISRLQKDAGGKFQATVVWKKQPVREFQVDDLNGDHKPDLLLADENFNRITILYRAGEIDSPLVRRLPTVSGPHHLLIADANGDGATDLFVAGKGGLVLHLRNAVDWFGPPRPITTASEIGALAHGDIDEDGHVDLGVADRRRGILTLFMGSGDGSFTPVDSYRVGRGPEALWIGDTTSDGTPDILVLNHRGNDLTFLPGMGQGRLAGRITILGKTRDFAAFTAADMNHDSKLDLAATSEQNRNLTVFIGDGRGRFVDLPPVPVGRQPRSLAAGDLNGDAYPDLAVANFGSDSVTILVGDGRGQMVPHGIMPVGSGPTAIVAADLRQRGRMDLAVANALSDSLSVLYGDGHGSFPEAVTLAVNGGPRFLIVGDRDEDGFTDLAVGSDSGDRVSIFYGSPQGLGRPRTAVLGDTIRPSVAADFDRDGHVDLAVPNKVAEAVDLIPGADFGAFKDPLSIPVGYRPDAVVAGDFNSDGFPDLAVLQRDTATISVLINLSRARPSSAQE